MCDLMTKNYPIHRKKISAKPNDILSKIYFYNASKNKERTIENRSSLEFFHPVFGTSQGQLSSAVSYSAANKIANGKFVKLLTERQSKKFVKI